MLLHMFITSYSHIRYIYINGICINISIVIVMTLSITIHSMTYSMCNAKSSLHWHTSYIDIHCKLYGAIKRVLVLLRNGQRISTRVLAS